MKNSSIVDVLIGNIRDDKEALQETDKQLEEIKEAKRVIVNRLKDYRKDVSVLLKYASDEHTKQLEALGFDFSESERGLNKTASLALDIIMKAEGNKLTNEELYRAYVKTFKHAVDAYTYTEFNIKCRSLFNTQHLLRTKGKDVKSSKGDVISLNGRIQKNQSPTKEIAQVSDLKNSNEKVSK